MATIFSAPLSVSTRCIRMIPLNLIRSTCAVVVMLSVLACATNARAAIMYGDFDGTTVMYLDVTESSITDPVALFGPPNLAGDALQFMPDSFIAWSGEGGPDQTVGVLTAEIQAKEGQLISNVLVRELFSYEMTGNSTSAVSIAGLLVLVDLTPGHGGTVYQVPLVVQGQSTPPWGGPDSATDLLATAFIDLSNIGATHVGLTFNDILQATSAEGTTSWIEKTDIELLVNVPEPASLVLLVAGMVAISSRRRVV